MKMSPLRSYRSVCVAVPLGRGGCEESGCQKRLIWMGI